MSGLHPHVARPVPDGSALEAAPDRSVWVAREDERDANVYLDGNDSPALTRRQLARPVPGRMPR
jgi:hypothetical protein